MHGGVRKLGAKMGAGRVASEFGEGKRLSKSWGIWGSEEMQIRVAWVNFLTYLKGLREK